MGIEPCLARSQGKLESSLEKIQLKWSYLHTLLLSARYCDIRQNVFSIKVGSLPSTSLSIRREMGVFRTKIVLGTEVTPFPATEPWTQTEVHTVTGQFCKSDDEEFIISPKCFDFQFHRF